MTYRILCIFLLLLTINSVYALEEGVSVPLVADKSTGDGEEGLLLGAEVIVTNGTGHVFVDTNPYTQVDLQGSARIAAMVASDVLGIDEKAYDFYYIIDISSPIIGGPSAGGALTVATIAAINKWPLKSGVVMTGMINPDESIGPVGGIPFKLEAAAAKNATLFLIPEGQSTVTVKKTNTDSSGSIITIDTEETVDVVELGKKLNVTVKEVSTIQDVVREFTGYEITKPTYKGTILTTQYMDLLKPLARNLKNESGDMYKEMESTLPKTQFLVTAKDILDRADKMYDDNKYYAATSLYFNSMYTMRFAQWNDGYDKASDKEQYLTEIINRVEKQINFSENDLRNFTLYGISDAEAVGAAESRITAAKVKLDEAKKLTDTQEKITSLAFAHERARTAQWWLTLATPDGKIVPENVLKDRAGWYLSQAQSINTYMFALVSETGSHPEIIVGGAGEDLDHAQKEMERGYYAGAIFDSLQATTKASTMIGLLGKTDAQKKVEESYEAAKVAINEARLAGIEPTLAVSAYEYGETMTNPYEQISQYSYARTIAKTSIVLKSHSIPSNQTPVRPVITPYVSMPFEPSVPAPNVTVKRSKTKIEVPGFEAVMAVSILLLFIARRLYKKNIRK